MNNAGAGWRARFADGGHANVSRTMELNFDAQVRLTEALLPLLRESAPSAIVNVSSVSGRVARAGSGAYSASKFALAGWSESLYLEERASGVHVGLVLPGFIATEGFPAEELKARLATRWMVSTPRARGRRHRGRRARAASPSATCRAPYVLATLARVLAPPLYRRVMSGGGASVMTTRTGADVADERRRLGRGRRAGRRAAPTLPLLSA